MPSSEFLLGHSLQAFDEQGRLIDEEQVAKLRELFKDFLLFVTITSQLQHAHQANKREAENFSWETI
ncbi:hypothetical protein SDC9_148320 [bioreactor metagenome]|uniref:Uncharacterized protein n=2 Tax=root TaxID=1 RepID=A0A645EH92_9ZZZZ